MRWTWASIAIVLLLAPGVAAQFMLSKQQTPDRYDFGPAVEYRPRYERDPKKPKQITNPDFFCTACAEEGRIPFGSRGDMKDVLEVEKVYPYPVDGKRRHPMGAFRLMEEKAHHVVRYLFGELEPRNPVFIEDRLFRLFVDLPAVAFKTVPSERRHEVLARLRDVFPKLKSSSRLDSHQRAHLYLIRAHRVRRDFERLVKHDPDAAYMDFEGPFLGNRQKFEVYVFPDKKALTKFMGAFVRNVDEGVDGLNLRTLKDDSMITMMYAPDGRDAWLNNAFTHRLAFNFLASYRGYRFDMPQWLLCGYAALMERRERTDFNSFVTGDMRVPKPKREADWKKAVRRAVSSGRFPRFEQYVQVTKFGTMPVDQRLIAWSQVSFLMQRSADKVGQFIQYLKDIPKEENLIERQKRGFERFFGMKVEDFEESWTKWVLAHY